MGGLSNLVVLVIEEAGDGRGMGRHLGGSGSTVGGGSSGWRGDNPDRNLLLSQHTQMSLLTHVCGKLEPGNELFEVTCRIHTSLLGHDSQLGDHLRFAEGQRDAKEGGKLGASGCRAVLEALLLGCSEESW